MNGEIYGELTEELYEALYIDVLTGAYNRRYYEERVRMSVTSAGVAMFDLDDFKLTNDTFGHTKGDRVLSASVSLIKSLIRKTDTLVRYGGDEFILVMPGISEENFERKLKEIRRLVSNGEDQKLGVSVSIGAVMATEEIIKDAVIRADKYMYRAKAHKNAIVTEWGMLDLAEHRGISINSGKQDSNILIVDDSAMNRTILCEMLKGEFGMLEAENGQEALHVLKKNRNRIVLVLLDIVMPVMDGFGVLNKMNEWGMSDDIPVIMISSEDSDDAIRKAYDLGVSDYISRPYDAQVVYRRVYNAIKLYAKQRRLTEILSEQMREKEKNSQIMVEILSHIVEFRNGESGAHVQHINVLTRLLLDRLEEKTDRYLLSWKEKDIIVMASSLHDIGKIGVDDKILNKQGRLTEQEYEIMKLHTVIGDAILNELKMYQNEPLVKTAHQVCRWHHERYDGKGYPDGLKGDEIPISAQVVSLADVYDALVSKRVYKEGYSHAKAMQMIVNGECGVFNPELIECLCEMQDDIREKVYANEEGE